MHFTSEAAQGNGADVQRMQMERFPNRNFLDHRNLSVFLGSCAQLNQFKPRDAIQALEDIAEFL